MNLLGTVIGLLGWKGAGTLAVVVLTAVTGAYQAGRFVEKAARDEAIERHAAEEELARLRAHNERLQKANEARHRTLDGAGRDGDRNGGVPDDGFRRD